MPKSHTWTAAEDAQLRRLRIEGVAWDTIAATFRMTRWTVIERGRRIGTRRPPPDFKPPPEDPAREPLPAGHPRSWGAITAGTLLEGTPYPLPVFL